MKRCTRKTLEKKLASIERFLHQQVEAGELELGALQDVMRSWSDLISAAQDDDHHMVKAAINEIAKKFQR